MRQLDEIKDQLSQLSIWGNAIEDARATLELYELEPDQEILAEATQGLNQLALDLNRWELERLLSGPYDKEGAVLSINAGAGGTDAQDWAQMLLRMYSRWSERKDFSFKIMHETPGEEAGIKSCTALIDGSYAFGYLKRESGVHRLVRISPFDSNSRRHTSFSSVWISPYVDESVQVDIQEKDLRIDTFRASGAGGQHVNTTDSAIRITHSPSGIVVQCQNERSQHKNRATAMNMLKSKLYEVEIQKLESDRKEIEGEKSEIGWGSQIRSYVLHPYRMVKDLRSNYEDSDPDSVLDGNIDKLIFSNLIS